MKLKSIIFGMLTLFGTLTANEGSRFTGLSYFSFPGDYIGGGGKAIYLEDQGGKFSVYERGRESVEVRFHGNNHSVWWGASFAAPRGEELAIGIYQDATRYGFQKKESPGLDFSGSGRGHNTSVGTFEILEIEYDEDGKIVAFAANFVQQGSWYHQQPYSPPLLGCVRYNSSIPVEKTFLLDIHENQRFQDWDEY